MKRPLLELFKRSGDAHIGQTLTRLARLAAASHRHQVKSQLSETTLREEQRRIQELDLYRVVHPPRTDVGSIHTEVDR